MSIFCSRKFFLTTLLTLITSVSLAEGILDANSASEDDLAVLPNMNAELAAAIVAGRPYATIGALNELLSANKIDEEQREALYGQLFVAIDLNNADESDILLIPGVGDKMAHEFEEYRPYSSIEQFRRELGKYVDEAEVARLEQYVSVE
jgi:DNA uptake protein ComE-like DNA-binding protein